MISTESSDTKRQTDEGPRPAVLFERVTKSFGAVAAVDGVDFHVGAGETVALLGPNGAGKSTAINMMLGLLHPDGGSLTILGGSPASAIRAGRIGAMLQSQQGLPTQATVAQLLRFAGELYARPLPLPDLLATAGLEDVADRRVENLSGGQTQRVRFAMAICGNPELLFLDEPTVAMDVEGRREFWASMRASAAAGRTILFATHYLEEADAAADRIVLLHRGRVVADGAPTEIKATVAARRVRFTLAGADPRALWGLDSVTDVQLRGHDVTLSTADADVTVRAMCRAGVPFKDLEVAGAGIEEAFLALTGETGEKGGTRR